MPKAQRSRACNQCRDRRVKCDETPEVCQQCRRLGLKCSGPLQGSVIIDMTDRVTKPRQRKKRDRPKAVVLEDRLLQQPEPTIEIPKPGRHEAESPSSVVLASKHNSPATTQPLVREAEDAILAIRQQHRLRMHYQPSMLYQPSLADTIDCAFVSHFVELNRGVRARKQEAPWIHALPGLHTKAKTQALKLSIRAASMAFYAQIHKEAPILVDSYRWYTNSLNSQRMSLLRLDGRSKPNDEQCLVPIILGLYEVYAGTTPMSVFQHLTAATKLLEMRGPSDCSSGVCLPLFRAIRVSDAHKSVVWNQPSVFSKSEWTTVPFSIVPKSAHHYLVDIILAIPACIALCGSKCSLSVFFSRPLDPTINLNRICDRAQELLRELDKWAEANPHLCTDQCTSDGATSDDSSTSQAPAVMLPDSFIALIAATFKATHIILSLLVQKVSPKTSIASVLNVDAAAISDSPAVDLVTLTTKQAEGILNISSCLESTHPVGFDFLRCVFPLVIVAILGPNARQQQVAREMLDRWGERRGLGGLCGQWVDI